MENVLAQAIISDEAVKAALAADQGEDATLDAWEAVPFTNKGDNYAAYVTGINVNYTKDDQKGKTSYVVKLNPCRPPYSEEIPDYQAKLFRKEGKFYMELLPELNLLMTPSVENRLPFPKCYYAQYTDEKEMIIFEDLRQRGFKMIDRKKGMDLQHAELVMQGFGRLHAASILMQKKLSIDDIKSKYPFLFEEFWEGKIILEREFGEGMKTSTNMLEKIGGYEKAIDWINALTPTPNLVDFFKNAYAIKPPFSVVCHGDCWSNNVLFRYTDSGIPVEIMILDVPLNRIASPATDLIFFMLTSMEGDVRKPNIERLLTDYFTSFSSVIRERGQDLPYTKEELVEEYKSYHSYGLVFGAVSIPPIILEGEDFPDLENTTSENYEKFMEDWNQLMLDSIDKNPICKSRFLSMFDEMSEEGLFD